MKKIKYVSFIMIALLFQTCQKDDVINKDTALDSTYLIGTWRVNEVTINGINSNHYLDWLNKGATLGINSDGSYYRNYVRGYWSLDNKKIILNPESTLNLPTWEYQILEYSKNTLVLKVELIEREYCCDFDEFESKTILTIIEKYERE